MTRLCRICDRRWRLALAWWTILGLGRVCSPHCFRRMAEGDS